MKLIVDESFGYTKRNSGDRYCLWVTVLLPNQKRKIWKKDGPDDIHALSVLCYYILWLAAAARLHNCR